MRPLRYSINVTLDGCCHHEAGSGSEAVHRHAIENFARADALLFGRVIYGMMESAFRNVDALPESSKPFARAIGAMTKYVVSSTLTQVDWNGAELHRGDLQQAVTALKQQPGKGLFVGGVTLPRGSFRSCGPGRPPSRARPGGCCCTHGCGGRLAFGPSPT